MKQNKVKLYATALAEILAEKKFDEKKVTSNFVKLLVSAGLEKKSKEILELAEEILLTKRGNKKIVIESARKITAGQRKVLDGIALKGDMVKEKINPELVAGVRITVNGNKQFDGSMKRKLERIFK